MRFFSFSVAIALIVGISACRNMTRDIDIELPVVPRQLVVECYLEPGQPYRLLLTETMGYFDDLSECPIIKGATVIISHNGVSDTLIEAPQLFDTCALDNFFGILPFFNADRTRFYNYGSSKLCPENYDQDFELHVIDHQGGREIRGRTRFLRAPEIDTIKATFNDQQKAYVTCLVNDDANTLDYYRLMLHDSTLFEQDPNIPFIQFSKDPEFDFGIDDKRFFNGGKIAIATNFDYETGDTLIFTVYHIDQTYYDYLGTLGANRNANGNPFAQPGRLLSNVYGDADGDGLEDGVGIFTFLSYDRDTIIIP